MSVLTKEQIAAYEQELAQYSLLPEREIFIPKGNLLRPVAVAHACFEIRDLLDTIANLERQLAEARELMPCGHVRANWVKDADEAHVYIAEGLGIAVPYKCSVCEALAAKDKLIERLVAMLNFVLDRTPRHFTDCTYDPSVTANDPATDYCSCGMVRIKREARALIKECGR